MWRWIVWFLTWLSADPQELEAGHAKASAAISAARASMVAGGDPTPAPDTSECCVECQGTGYITHGDGHRTQCPCPPECKCKQPKAVQCEGGQCTLATESK